MTADLHNLAGRVRARHCEPGGDGEAHALAVEVCRLLGELDELLQAAKRVVDLADHNASPLAIGAAVRDLRRPVLAASAGRDTRSDWYEQQAATYDPTRPDFAQGRPVF